MYASKASHPLIVGVLTGLQKVTDGRTFVKIQVFIVWPKFPGTGFQRKRQAILSGENDDEIS